MQCEMIGRCSLNPQETSSVMYVSDLDAKCRQAVEEYSMRNALQTAEARIIELEKEVAHWEANHNNQVKLKAAIMDRPDLKDRAEKVLAMQRDIDLLSGCLNFAISYANDNIFPSKYMVKIWSETLDKLK